MGSRNGSVEQGDRLALAAALDELPRATAWLDALADREGWPDRTRFAMQLSLEEALVNVISYGFQDRAPEDASIALVYDRVPGMARLLLTDNGTPFDPTSISHPKEAPSIEEAEIGGHGVQLMRHLLDEFSYCQVDGNNQLILGSQFARAG